jgi:hypothetical protein
VFSQLHQDKEVQSWAEVTEAEEEWQKTKTTYDAVMRSARELDRIANLKLELELSLDDLTVDLLHRAYRDTFKACKLKGIHRGLSKQVRVKNTMSPVPVINVFLGLRSAGNEETDFESNS